MEEGLELAEEGLELVEEGSRLVVDIQVEVVVNVRKVVAEEAPEMEEYKQVDMKHSQLHNYEDKHQGSKVSHGNKENSYLDISPAGFWDHWVGPQP